MSNPSDDSNSRIAVEKEKTRRAILVAHMLFMVVLWLGIAAAIIVMSVTRVDSSIVDDLGGWLALCGVGLSWLTLRSIHKHQ